ncbi:MAG: ribbon-helix-helix protein, CopG family [Propionibacterium sp.]|nr:ribbon-helix-helix protein, CopG family [Propionibacterium sp.]
MPTSIRLPKEIEQRIDELARRTQRSRSFYLREAVERALPDLEWEYGIVQRAQDVRSGRARTIGLDRAVNELGLDD